MLARSMMLRRRWRTVALSARAPRRHARSVYGHRRLDAQIWDFAVSKAERPFVRSLVEPRKTTPIYGLRRPAWSVCPSVGRSVHRWIHRRGHAGRRAIDPVEAMLSQRTKRRFHFREASRTIASVINSTRDTNCSGLLQDRRDDGHSRPSVCRPRHRGTPAGAARTQPSRS